MIENGRILIYRRNDFIMTKIAGKKILAALVLGVVLLMLPPFISNASDKYEVDHPLMPPAKEFSGQCSVCGMMRSMWARTWITFDETDGISEVCSFHCLAELSLKSGVLPGGIKLAAYHDPKTMLDCHEAIIVLGSSAKGTMSPESKIVFADIQDAEAFISLHGGKTALFQRALDIAITGVAGENDVLFTKRIKNGKIIEPSADDRCLVCEMFPSRYPKHKCQIQTKDKRIYHFCSTRCLFTFLKNPAQYGRPGFDPLLIWVTDFSSGKWTGGRCAYYVSGAKDVYGPMGVEAFPFNNKNEAMSFIDTHGGKLLLFKEVDADNTFP